MVDGDSTRKRRMYSVQEASVGGDPYPQYAWFRAHDPVHVGKPGWPMGRPQVMLFRHADVTKWLKDPRMIRNFSLFPEFQVVRKQRWNPPGPDTFAHVSRQFMLFQDPPDHSRLRRLANQAFTPRLVADQRDGIETIVADLLNTFRTEQGGEGDLIQAIAYQLPVLVVARILGIPQEDMHRFRAWSAVVGVTIDSPTESVATVQSRVDDATRDLCEYLRAMVLRRYEQPGNDLVSQLIAAGDDGDGKLSEDELVAMCVLIMTAGHETMANVIANGILALMRHRTQWDRLVADLSLAGNATDELLRYDSPVQFTSRIAGEDVEIGGVRVARGSEVLFMFGSANRDEAVWEEPDLVRLDRQVGRHLAFGTGVHFCMGAPLARLEFEIVLRTLARGAPNLELADPEPVWRPVLHGLKRLDVRLNS